MTTKLAPASAEGLFLGAYDLTIKGEQLDCTVPSQFFHNYQKEESVWAEITPPPAKWIYAVEVKVTSPGCLEPFSASTRGVVGKQSGGSLSFSAEISPNRIPIESTPSKGLRKVTFALLDSPLFGDLIADQRPSAVTLPCGQFNINITEPTKLHEEVQNALGTSPHRLSHSGSMVARNGKTFTSKDAALALTTLHTALSFAAGRWAGITLVEASNAADERKWFQWGKTRMSGTPHEFSWYDSRHSAWLTPLCDGFRKFETVEGKSPVEKALYWFVRSNTRGAGIDSSLILSQCALELLSWFVIVKETGALSEEGYGQIGSASEKLRLALTLLGIPRQIPTSLKGLYGRRKDWKDLADALVQARNYLVHPTQGRSGKMRPDQEYPWFELWIAGQWLLELVILRLLRYSGDYRNRTRFREFNPIERVPWAH